MNERIKELADRLWRVHPSDIDAMGLKTRTEFYEHELKKFAELIVQECALVAYKTAWDDLTLDYGIGTIPLHIHNTIKEHFGVE